MDLVEFLTPIPSMLRFDIEIFIRQNPGLSSQRTRTIEAVDLCGHLSNFAPSLPQHASTNCRSMLMARGFSMRVSLLDIHRVHSWNLPILRVFAFPKALERQSAAHLLDRAHSSNAHGDFARCSAEECGKADSSPRRRSMRSTITSTD